VQYTRELLFSSIVELMSPVVCAIHPSAGAAYKPARDMNVSLSAVHAKLNGIELEVSRAWYRQAPMAEIDPVGWTRECLWRGIESRY